MNCTPEPLRSRECLYQSGRELLIPDLKLTLQRLVEEGSGKDVELLYCPPNALAQSGVEVVSIVVERGGSAK